LILDCFDGTNNTDLPVWISRLFAQTSFVVMSFGVIGFKTCKISFISIDVSGQNQNWLSFFHSHLWPALK
jgi:hypothetical protein